MRRLRSIATSVAWVLIVVLAVAGCNGVIFIGGNFGDASITGQVSVIRITIISDGATSVRVTIVTFLNATSSFGGLGAAPAAAQDVTFCGHIGDRFTMNAVQTVSFNQGQVCGTVVSIRIG
jgi:hypothetical protein